MEIKTIAWGSPAYEQMIGLRHTYLLEPIGIPASYINREKEKNDILIGAFEGQELWGGCVLTPLDSDTIQLRQMVVRTDLHKKGVGAALLGFAEKEAAKLDARVLMMHARDPVIGFYEKCGYTVVGEQFFEVGMGHHRMEKSLRSPF